MIFKSACACADLYFKKSILTNRLMQKQKELRLKYYKNSNWSTIVPGLMK